ncbi:TPA: YSIRK-type signal peptide-containing protein, partial [Streptococcus suis]|nr:YSIRK-type signal peptide-containing protein [Streptococcus suis]
MNRQDKNYQKLYQYSIRKRNWGVGSVVVGIFLAGMLQAPTVLANTGATAADPTIENQVGTGDGVAGSSEEVQPVATPGNVTSAGVAETRTTSQPTESSDTSSSTNTVNNDISLDPKYVLGDNALLEVSKEKISVEASDVSAWQNTRDYPRGIQNLLNGDHGDDTSANDNTVLTELKWGGSKSLPQDVTFTFTEISDIDHLKIYKRNTGVGNLTKFTVTVYGENEEIIGPTSEVVLRKEDSEGQYSLVNFSNIKKVKVSFTEAVNAQGQVSNGDLTIKGVSFFAKSDVRGNEVNRTDLTVSGNASAYENGQGLNRLNDGKISLKTEMKWNETARLPQTITVRRTDSGPIELTGVAIYKRPGDWGSLKKYTLVTKKDGNQVESIDVDVVRDATLSSVALSGAVVDTVEVIVKEVFNRQGQVANNQLSLREIKLFEKAPLPIPEEETPQPPVSEQNPPAGDTGEQ